MIKVTYFLLLASLIVFFTTCSKSDGGGSALDCSIVANKAWTADISPIVASICSASGCHNTGSINGPGALTNYTQVFNNRTAIRAAVQAGTMPQGSTLTTSQKNSILCWIDSGAPMN